MTSQDTRTPIVFITGGSRGIGAAIAQRCAAGGFDIWLNYRCDHDAATQVRRQVEDQGRQCLLLPFDVADEDAVAATLEPLLEQATPFGFIHNAGITRDGLAAMMPRQQWDQVLNVHLTGFFLLVRPLLRAMLARRQGRIIAIGSVSGETGHPGQINYAAAKAGLAGACRTLAREVARRHILVNVVSPGFIDTDMTRDLPRDQILPRIPLGRMGTVEEVAGLAHFLLTEEAAYITGQVLAVNGGLHMG